jgi:nitrite reductase/ring-hydroxylating ferredoxin subunit
MLNSACRIQHTGRSKSESFTMAKVKVAGLMDLSEGHTLRVDANGRPLLLSCFDGQFFAIDAICSHAGGRLEDGDFEGRCVVCPIHSAVFDLTTGKVSPETHLSIPGVSLRDIDHPRAGFRPYAALNRVIETHLRDQYPPYWLVVYDKKHGVTHPNLIELRHCIREILEKKATRGKLPANLTQVWAFDWPSYAKNTISQVWP